jgi:hypothetical protein
VTLLGRLLLAYTAASFVHFAHNAAYASAYPDLPEGLTAGWIMTVWAAEGLTGLAGWIALRRGRTGVGLAAIAGYATLGFDGLGHYALAPISAHSLAMNLTIALEVAAAALLLGATPRTLVGGSLGSGRAA